MAEAVGFEPTNGCPLPVFKTGAIDHSATLPGSMRRSAVYAAARVARLRDEAPGPADCLGVEA